MREKNKHRSRGDPQKHFLSRRNNKAALRGKGQKRKEVVRDGLERVNRAAEDIACITHSYDQDLMKLVSYIRSDLPSRRVEEEKEHSSTPQGEFT